MELEVTWERLVRVWWSWLWRALIVNLVVIVIAFMVGFIVGLVMGVMGFPKQAIQVIAGLIGLGIGICATTVPMKMILGKDFGEFRLVLLAKQPPAVAPPAPPQTAQS
jgi:type III secretory pathway component EscS